MRPEQTHRVRSVAESRNEIKGGRMGGKGNPFVGQHDSAGCSEPCERSTDPQPANSISLGSCQMDRREHSTR